MGNDITSYCIYLEHYFTDFQKVDEAENTSCLLYTSNAGNIMHAILVMMNWKIIHLPQQHRKKLILFYAETAAGNLHFRNTKKAAALTAMQDLIQNAVYMRIFISVVQIQRIQNSKKFCILFLFVKKSDILIEVRIN